MSKIKIQDPINRDFNLFNLFLYNIASDNHLYNP